MTPSGPHPASHSGPRTTTRHPARSIYQPGPGSYLAQQAERDELCGLGPDPDPVREGFEQDLQDDLDRERHGDDTGGWSPRPRFPKVLRLRRINTTDNEKRAA